jgi:hypothetical protein
LPAPPFALAFLGAGFLQYTSGYPVLLRRPVRLA